jgi:uroporphyrinogen III methyltransferase/synthase
MVKATVLITRPEAEAALLASTLKRRGTQTVSIPAFRFESGSANLNFSNAWNNGGRRLAIFSSPRAVEFGLKQLPPGFLGGVEIAAIGPATRQRLEAAGYKVPIVPESEFNSESLLQHPALLSEPGSAVIFAAPGGRQRLFLGLAALGWKAQFAHVYRAVPLQPGKQETQTLLQAEHILSLWTSSNAMDHLAGHLDGMAWERICVGDFVVTSARLAKLASHYCKGRVTVSSGPDNDALAAAVADTGL